jgi:hypothetical protein
MSEKPTAKPIDKSKWGDGPWQTELDRVDIPESFHFHQNIDTTNRLLQKPQTTAMGFYALGIVSCLAEQDGVVAPDALLEAAAECQTVAGAIKLYRTLEAAAECQTLAETIEFYRAFSSDLRKARS